MGVRMIRRELHAAHEAPLRILEPSCFGEQASEFVVERGGRGILRYGLGRAQDPRIQCSRTRPRH